MVISRTYCTCVPCALATGLGQHNTKQCKHKLQRHKDTKEFLEGHRDQGQDMPNPAEDGHDNENNSHNR